MAKTRTKRKQIRTNRRQTRTKRKQTRTKRRQTRTKRRQTRTKRKQDNVGRGVTQSKGINIQEELNDIPTKIIEDLTIILDFKNNDAKKIRFKSLIKKFYRNIDRLTNTTEITNRRIESTISRKTKRLEEWGTAVIPLKEKNFINKNKAMYYLEFLKYINKDINIINQNSKILNDEDINRNINNYFLDKQIDNYIQTLIDNIEYVVIDKIE